MHGFPCRPTRAAAALLLAGVALAGCDLAPPIERQSEAAQKAQEHTELRDATRREDLRERAANAGQPVEEHDKRQAQAIEDAGG
jgi:hypothetical protein